MKISQNGPSWGRRSFWSLLCNVNFRDWIFHFLKDHFHVTLRKKIKCPPCKQSSHFLHVNLKWKLATREPSSAKLLSERATLYMGMNDNVIVRFIQKQKLAFRSVNLTTEYPWLSLWWWCVRLNRLNTVYYTGNATRPKHYQSRRLPVKTKVLFSFRLGKALCKGREMNV